MPFMEHAALKARSLKSCPGETNCRNAWHYICLSEEFFIQRQFDMQSLAAQSAILSNARGEVINVQQDIWHFQFFLPAVAGLEEKAAAFFMFLPLCHLVD